MPASANWQIMAPLAINSLLGLMGRRLRPGAELLTWTPLAHSVPAAKRLMDHGSSAAKLVLRSCAPVVRVEIRIVQRHLLSPVNFVPWDTFPETCAPSRTGGGRGGRTKPETLREEPGLR